MQKRNYYGFIGNGLTNALVSPHGGVEWLCAPYADSPFALGKLLDSRAGSWEFELNGFKGGTQRYREDSSVLETALRDDRGRVLLTATDFMPWGEDELIRIVEPPEGGSAPSATLALRPTFDYMRSKHELQPSKTGPNVWAARFVPESGRAMTLHANQPIEAGADGSATVRWNGKSPLAAILRFSEDAAPLPAPPLSHARDRLAATLAWSRDWVSRFPYAGPHADLYRRSLLTMKLLSFHPTGALLAAGTMGVPYRLGSGLNWDYRFAWVRDGAFAAEAFADAGCFDEARAFIEFLFRAQETQADQKPWQVLYDIRGGKDATEFALEHIEGYLGDRLVYVGNAAFNQFQMDAEGEVLALVWRYVRRSGDAGFVRAWWDNIRRAADWTARNWRRKDQGIWEIRGVEAHYTHTKIMCWTALDRAARMADLLNETDAAARWRAEAAKIRRQALRNAWNPKGRFLMMGYNFPLLDASALPAILTGMAPSGHPKAEGTLRAVEKQLVFDRLTARNFIEPTPFQLTTFWLARCLALAGRRDDALAIADRCAGLTTDLGLFQEHLISADDLPELGPAYILKNILRFAANANWLADGPVVFKALSTYFKSREGHKAANAQKPAAPPPPAPDFKKPYGNFPQIYSHEEFVMTLKLLEDKESLMREMELFAPE